MGHSTLSMAISALREGRWIDYDVIARDLLSGGGQDELWEGIAAAHPTDLNLIDTIINWPIETARNCCNRLFPAVGKLPSLLLADALRLLTYASIMGSSFGYTCVQHLRPHIARQPSLGIQIGEHLRSASDADEASQRLWASAFAPASSRTAAEFALKLTTGGGISAHLLVYLIQMLPADSPDVQVTLTPREKDISDILFGCTAELGQSAWAALTCFIDISPTAMGYLLAALDADEPNAAIAMSNALYGIKHPAVGVTREPLERIVQRLLKVALKDEQVLHHVDNGIESLLYQGSLRPHAVSCLHDLCTAECRVAEQFSSTFAALGENGEDFAYILSSWLLRAEANFDAIRSLLSRCTLGQVSVGLDSVAFAKASSERRIKAARRLLALTLNGPTLCQFISAITEMTALGEERIDLGRQMLHTAFDEYPTATGDFLKEKAKACSRSAPEAGAYRTVYTSVLRWHRVLRRIPALEELRPTDSELHILRTLKNRLNREILRGAAERSIFANMVSSVHIAQGRKVVIRTPYGSPQVVPMGEASHSIELPSSELADPMRGHLQRIHLLRDAR